jgi:hypothetical protein
MGLIYRARRPGGGPWQQFGRDYVSAIAAFKAWQTAKGDPGTVGELLDTCVGRIWPDKVKAKQLAPRTLSDYAKDCEVLRDGLGHIPLTKLEPKHVAKYRTARQVTNPTHVRNEMACLSSAISWAIEEGLLKVNVCKEVSRPRKLRRERLITDAEYLAVHKLAIPSVQLAMVIGIRTLGLPADTRACRRRRST